LPAQTITMQRTHGDEKQSNKNIDLRW